MTFDFSVKDAVTKRYSVRTYDKKVVEQEVKEKILAYAQKLHNPLGPKMKVQFIEKKSAPNGEKLGTYGIIKGAQTYLGVTVKNEEYALEALGYDFEHLVLYATSIKLGTCWLGGTFNRNAFTSAMNIEEGEIFPILSPLGYPAQRKSITEQIMRKSIHANGRLPWKELFFKNDFHQAFSIEEAGRYKYPLEMLRRAPSAANKQPWRVVVSGKKVHFFQKGTMLSEVGSVDMQRIDMGIGICHFHLAAMERKMTGHFERCLPEFEIPSGMTYIVSWVKDE